MHRVTSGVVLLLIVGLGAYLRLAGLGARPFWRDEACVAELVRDLPPPELLRQTSLASPPLHTLTAKFAGAIVPPPELGYRLPSACWGILTIPLMYAVLRKLRLPGGASLLCTAAASLSLALVIWSREFRQYAAEAFFSVLAAWLALSILNAATRRKLALCSIALVFVAAVAPWLGYGVAFSIATVAAALVAAPASAARRTTARVTGVAMLAALAATLGAVSAFAAQAQSQNAALRSFNRRWMIDALDLESWMRAAYDFCGFLYMGWLPLDWQLDRWVAIGASAAIAALSIAGLSGWPRASRRFMLIWTVLPLILMAAASVAGRYPFGVPRTMLCAMPGIVLSSVFGVIVTGRWISRRLTGRRRPGWLAATLVLLAPAALAVRETGRGGAFVYHDAPAILAALHERRDAEAVLVSINQTAEIRYYAGASPPGFIYFPITAGTLAIPGHDYSAEIADRIYTAGSRWWLINDGGAESPELIFDIAKARGYRATRVAAAGTENPSNPFGVSQLWLVTRD